MRKREYGGVDVLELEQGQFEAAAPLFARAPYGALSGAVLEGDTPGRVFVDRLSDPASALVATGIGYYYLAGESGNPAFSSALPELFASRLIPASLAAGERQFLLFYHPRAWEPVLLSLFAGKGPILIRKKRMTLPVPAQTAYRHGLPPVPAGCSLEPLSEHALAEAGYSWRGLGFRLLHNGQEASTCAAVFVAGGEAEASVHTAAAYRRRGLATLVAGAFIHGCLSRGLAPVWGCFPENQASVALARKLGFEDDCDHPICFWEEPAMDG